MTTPTHKTCPACSRYLQIEEFGRDVSKASGRKSACKGCEAFRSRCRWAPRPRWLEPAAVAESPQTCRCEGGPLIDRDEDGVAFCVRCGRPVKPSKLVADAGA